MTTTLAVANVSTSRVNLTPMSTVTPTTPSASLTTDLSKGTSYVASTSTATNSTTSSSGTTKLTKNHSISPGAAAGIGVGSAVAGALIAALILWFMMRKARKGRMVPSEDRGYPPLLLDKLGGTTVEPSLQQPLSDQNIRDEFSTVCTVINNHVQSFYHTAPPSMKVENANQAALEVLGQEPPLIASNLVTLLSGQETRLPAIRFCIAWIVVSRIGPDCEPNLTFLPPEIARCLGSMSASKIDQQNDMALLSKWRAISAALLQKTYGKQQTLSGSDSRYRNIEKALQALDKVLHPYADQSRGDDKRFKNLEEILKRGARTGFLLFSQPSVWRFDWDRPGDIKAGTMTVFPALTKVGDDYGQTISTPRVLFNGEAAQGGVGAT
ncbi:hypothetical protein MMC22_010237 [Lobaria immixta]|nr:hypothetical protein [Lobaria immixta]